MGSELDMQRLLLGHGYLGRGTVAPPNGPLRENLVSFKDTGGPQHGAGAASALAHMPFADNGFDKWENRLAPDLKRAAPEIYRSLRSAGSSSVRDWLGQNYEGSRKSTEWTDLWNIATRSDFLFTRAGGPSEFALVFATDSASRST